ncbi:right-handed parallel beta-helix repeat-containing protein [Ancylomarina sp. 16SWW S1-10-2]|uniref:right-handed parallel beta-helix repeat-containing protein n=1 Tax=Ancylomarina sp. 16SWW S1-10-2 TaxID=2499681 RepID=UPI0012ADCDCB|nr:right-handed parallel beta-helix repeat-containing protein [Ancylomarina sp. 16SWW S1-10-2]MRT93414.1 hypothetical protein [Ancylomarina sp. 16SWW S1-10-2]
MKNLFYLYFISALFFASCDEVISIDEEIISPPEEVIPPADPDPTSTPSSFDFTTIQAKDTLNIAFSHDLGGKSIEIPADVVINYNEGEIVNGTFVFTNGKIAGELLNKNLIIEGTPTLTSTTFEFEKSKWEITEGEVSDDIALVNKETIQKVIDDVTSYGAEVFQIDDLDAYFQVTSERNLIWSKDEAISLPSNFTLEMTDNTYLRVQPNKYFRYALFELRSVENVNLIGGNLYGDRDFHTYDPIVTNGLTYKTHEWGNLIQIKSGVNVTVKNMKLMDAAGDGLEIGSIGHTFSSYYVASSNILVSNCTFDSNRRNNLSITDGDDMIVENNTFLNAGIDTPYSEGTAPRMGIDIEAGRGRSSDGTLIYYERASNIIIRNNIEKGSLNASFYVAIGEDVTIENNTTESAIGLGVGTRITIRGNKITSSDGNGSTGIVGGRLEDNESVFGNEISGNIINGYTTGISVRNSDVKVFGNEIKECITSITVRNLKDAEIYDNIITTTRDAYCYGISIASGNVDDVLIRDNEIEVAYKPISFINVNAESGQENNVVTVKGNNLNGGKVHISNSNGIVVE